MQRKVSFKWKCQVHPEFEVDVCSRASPRAEDCLTPLSFLNGDPYRLCPCRRGSPLKGVWKVCWGGGLSSLPPQNSS